MFIFLIRLFLIVSSAGILFIIFRQISKLRQLPAQPEIILPPQPLSKRLLLLKNAHVLSYALNLISVLEKILRKLRVVFLKIDNVAIYLIQKAKEKSQVLTVRSRAWMEQRLYKKSEKSIDQKPAPTEEEKTIETKDEPEAKSEARAVKINRKIGKNIGGQPVLMSAIAELDRQEQVYIKLLAENPKDIETYRRLGELYLSQGNLVDATEAFRQILKLKPRDRKAKEQLRGLLD